MKLISFALAIASVFPVVAHAQLVDLKWNGGVFSHNGSIAPTKFLEVCGKLKQGDGVGWQFKGKAPTDFNIHYHVGKDVTYPENRKAVASADGMFLAPIEQDYCWMWTNRSATPVEVVVELRQAN
jgi:hypothetical protein